MRTFLIACAAFCAGIWVGVKLSQILEEEEAKYDRLKKTVDNLHTPTSEEVLRDFHRDFREAGMSEEESRSAVEALKKRARWTVEVDGPAK